MKNALFLALLTSSILFSCGYVEPEPEIPTLEKDKNITFEFYTDKDYSSSQYDTYFVNLNVGVSLVDKNTAQEIKIVEETTGWIPFKDIPYELNKMKFWKLVPVDINRYKVSYGYFHQVKIGETIQMKAFGKFLEKWEDEKLITIKF
ncbi:hypothetical protein [Algoriphagus sp.]|jgi:hypothetical protein|uniref:hypothetical protein n=1 Tax=Algoriphagus sp. TaxID=1872435 RepID=UPI002715D5B0|nr:hypothetical protein [Algoriphagus sp.]MDO8968688.1 hypothetical protein [Algoriphagus sp.]MDP3200290.1 hypothetical protein [Algoriphagus sp.]